MLQQNNGRHVEVGHVEIEKVTFLHSSTLHNGRAMFIHQAQQTGCFSAPRDLPVSLADETRLKRRGTWVRKWEINAFGILLLFKETHPICKPHATSVLRKVDICDWKWVINSERSHLFRGFWMEQLIWILTKTHSRVSKYIRLQVYVLVTIPDLIRSGDVCVWCSNRASFPPM